MKNQINWHLFNISNNYLLRKKIDDCIILYDDKDYITFNVRYYEDILHMTNHNLPFESMNIYNIFETEIEGKLKQIITYEDFCLVPIYFSETKQGIQIINIGIFIMSKFAFKANKYYDEFHHCFMSLIKYGIEGTDTNIKELREKNYPELKADIDDVLYIKQAGFYFNLFKSLYYSYNNSLNKIYIKLPIETENNIYMIDVVDIFKTIYPYWQRWQIIWRSNKYAITQYLKFRPWTSMSSITDNTTKKYRNIVFNQSLMSENQVLNSLPDFSLAGKYGNPPINDKVNKKKRTKRIKDIDDSDKELSTIIDKIGTLQLRKGSITKEKQLANYSRFSGSKHLHYLKKDKIKEKSILNMLKDLHIIS